MSENAHAPRTSRVNSPEQFVLFDNLTAELDGRTLLKEETLVIKPGEVMVLTGHSGVDKSVLADLVFNLPGSGEVQLQADTLGEPRAQGALVFPDSGGLPHLSVNDNLRLVSGNQYRCEQVAERFALKPEGLASNLSGGERRRLAVARALLANRRFLWLDEPEAGLDIKHMEELAVMLKKQAREEQLAIVVTTHNTVFASDIADRVLFLGRDGQLAEINAPPEPDSGFADTDAQVAVSVSSDIALQKPEGVDHNTFCAELARRLADSERHAQSGGVSPFSGFSRIMFRLRRLFDLNAFGWLYMIARSVPCLPGILSNRQARSTFFLSLGLSARHCIMYYPLLGAVFGAVLIMLFKYAMPVSLFYEQHIQTYGADIVYRISPPIAAVLAAACAGSTLSSWIGQLSSARQFDALKVLDAQTQRLVLAPAWWGLWFATMLGTIGFALALSAVFAGYLYLEFSPNVLYDLPYPPELFWSSLLVDQHSRFPHPELGIALLKSAGYGALVSGVTVSCAAASLRSSSDVAAAVTRAIVWSSVLVMLAELTVLLGREESIQAHLAENAQVIMESGVGLLTELVNSTRGILETMYSTLAEFIRSAF